MNDYDYSQYYNWEPVQLPTGATYYIVPGTGWAYDPFTSSQTGKVQLFSNPKQRVADEKQTRDEHDAAISLAKKQSGVGQQLMGVGLPIAAGLGGKYLYDNYLAKEAVSAATKTAATAAQTAATTPAAASSGLMNYGNYASGLQTSPYSLGVDTSLTGAPAVPSFGFDTDLAQVLDTQVAPLGTNTGATAMARLSPDALNAAAGETTTPESTGFLSGLTAQAPGTTLMGNATLGSMLPAAGIAAGLYTGMQQFGGIKNAFKGKKLSGMQQAALALPTFGASLLWNHIPGLVHKSTKQYEAERWGDLADKGITGAQEAFAAGHAADDDHIWKEGPTAGKEWNWEDAVMRAKAKPSEFRGVYGNFDTFGNDWATYDPAQQDKIVTRLIDENLYDPDKGDITISDKDRARKIKDEVLSSDPATSTIKNPLTVAPNPFGTPPVQAGAAMGAIPMNQMGFKPLPIGPQAPQIGNPMFGAPPAPAPTMGPPMPGLKNKTLDITPPPPPSPVAAAPDPNKLLNDATRYNRKLGEVS